MNRSFLVSRHNHGRAGVRGVFLQWLGVMAIVSINVLHFSGWTKEIFRAEVVIVNCLWVARNVIISLKYSYMPEEFMGILNTRFVSQQVLAMIQVGLRCVRTVRPELPVLAGAP